MEGPWLISYIALWCLTLALALLFLAHSRLLGLLHHRLSPSAARPLDDGPELGTRLDRIDARQLDGTPASLAFPAEADRMLIFVSPQCPTCNTLMPHVQDFVRAHRDVEVLLISTLDHQAMNRAYIAYRRLEGLAYLLGADLAATLGIEGTPYALAVDRRGVVVAKGLVNHYEHLLSLRMATAADPPGFAVAEHASGSTP